MSKTITLDHKDISDAQKITEVTDNAFKAKDVNLHVHEVTNMEDDFKTGKRHLTVKNTKYFSTGMDAETYDRIFKK